MIFKVEKNKIIRLLFLLFLNLGLPTFIFAEIITLKSGKKIEGKIVDKTDKFIKINSHGVYFYYRLQDVERIEESKSQISPPQVKFIPENTNAYLQSGFDYASKGEFGAAEAEFREGLKINISDHNLQEALRMIEDFKNGIFGQEYARHLFKGSAHLINAQYQLFLRQLSGEGYSILALSNYSLGNIQ